VAVWLSDNIIAGMEKLSVMSWSNTKMADQLHIHYLCIIVMHPGQLSLVVPQGVGTLNTGE